MRILGYNNVGQIVQREYTDLTNPNLNRTYAYIYNEAGLVVTEEELAGERLLGTTTYTYDEHGNIITMLNSRGGLPINRRNTYDDQGQLIKEETLHPMNASAVMAATEYFYDNGLVVKEVHYSSDIISSIIENTYNEAGQLIKSVTSEPVESEEETEEKQEVAFEVTSTTTYAYADIDVSLAPLNVQAVAGDGNTVVVTWEGSANSIVVDGKFYTATGNSFTTPVLTDGTYTIYVVNNGNATASNPIGVVDNTKVGVSDVRLNGEVTASIVMEKNRDGEIVPVTYYYLPIAWTLPTDVQPIGYRIYYNSIFYVDVDDGILRNFVIPAKDITRWDMTTMSVITLPFAIRVIAIYETGQVEPENLLFLNTDDILNLTPTKQQYTLSYQIDGAVYKSYTLIYGSPIIPETPQKEGYTFSGWDNLPTTMPNHDVTVTGSFIVNQYTITYKIDGNVYETQTVDYGTTINSPNPPELIGYTFKWDNVPATMPTTDITIEGRYVPNVYKITYWVDDVSYKVVDVAYGANIVAETDPEKDGYTFSGWSEMPTTMPAHDVTVTGSFTINTYKVIYMVNGEEYKSFEVEYGANVPIAEALEREGYTFSGWSMIPATMPAHDIVITASFTKGAYKLIYIVDGEVYKILSYDFEDGITPESAPVEEGYTFSGWSEIPETMPANDVAVTGTFSINHYTLTLMVGDNVYETLTLDYASSIVLPDMPALTGYTFSWGEAPATMPAKDLTITGDYTPISYNVTYLINGQFYAIVKLPYGTTITPPDVPERDGLTFAWIDVPETMPAHDITIEGTYTDGLMEVKAGMSASGIYNLSGQRLSMPQRGVNIINGKKIVVK